MRCVVAALVGMLLPSVAWAGDRAMWGGMGYMSQGWMMGDVSGAGQALGESAPGMALSLGGGGMALVGGVLALRGQGQGLIGLDRGGVDLDAQVVGGGGGFAVGVLAVNAEDNLLIPYVGVAMHGVDVSLVNGNNPAEIAGITLGAGDREVLTGGGLALDVGANMTRLFWSGTDGGMVLGGEMGGWIPLVSGGWSAASGAQPTGLDRSPVGLYMRVNVGGGGAIRQ